MSTLASGISMELSPTLDRNTVLTCTQRPATCVSTKHQSIFSVSCLTSAQCPSFCWLKSSAPYTSTCNTPPRDTWISTRLRGISAHDGGARRGRALPGVSNKTSYAHAWSYESLAIQTQPKQGPGTLCGHSHGDKHAILKHCCHKNGRRTSEDRLKAARTRVRSWWEVPP